MEINTVQESTELTTAPTSTIDSTTQAGFTTSTRPTSADTSPEIMTTSPQTTETDVSNGVSMVPASTLYGVAAGLSVTLFIAILAIIYLIWRKNQDSEFDDKDNVSKPGNGTAHVHENTVVTEHETSKEIDVRPSPKMTTFTGNSTVTEPAQERENINEKTGSNQLSEADLFANKTAATNFSAPPDPKYATVNKEENTGHFEEEPFDYDKIAQSNAAPKNDFEEELYTATSAWV
uniref:uncharacterized protein LOC120339287 n=1 Tax=Styela clava TaxID=7725 RepID=UPI0019393BED|nr:uncharacterized protein LOC120339287 [Styela clava]